MSTYSKNTTTATPKANFKKYHVHEIAETLTEAKYISDDLSNNYRYQHRAKVTIIGNVNLAPYEPIYLDGLPNGMSGYWTVLSVKHIFGGSPADYMCELLVGTDVIGDTNPDAKNVTPSRDVQAEISNQSLVAPDAALVNYSTSVNGSSLIPNYGSTAQSPAVTKSPFDLSDTLSPVPYAVHTPDFSKVKRTVKWVATKPNRVIK